MNPMLSVAATPPTVEGLETAAPPIAPAEQAPHVAARFASMLGSAARTLAGRAPATCATGEHAENGPDESTGSVDHDVAPVVQSGSEQELAALRAFVSQVARPDLATVPAPTLDGETPAETDEYVPASGASRATSSSVPAERLVPVRDLELLHPTLRIKVERVITRMSREHGHEVKVVETVRSQERQDHLFAQGRTRDGEIVTWTQQSRHTHGLAADLMVDGGWDNTAAYARLQRIARQEGLHTLGPSDPGHVELPHAAGHRSVSASVGDDPAASSTDTHRTAPERARQLQAMDVSAKPSAGMTEGSHAQLRSVPIAQSAAQVAHVARVAEVAAVAQSASVASVASVAPMSRAATVARTAIERPVGTAGIPVDVPDGERPDADVTEEPPPVDTTSRRAEHTMPREGQHTRAAARSMATAIRASARTGFARALGAEPRGGERTERAIEGSESATLGTEWSARMDTMVSQAVARAEASSRPKAAVHAASAPAGASTGDRAERIEALHDAVRARPLQSLTLRVEDADGADHRIRVDLRGDRIAAHIAASDLGRVAALTERLPELRQRLGEAGYEPAALHVRTLGGEAPGASHGAKSEQDADRPTAQQQHHHHQSRHRARRDQEGDPR